MYPRKGRLFSRLSKHVSLIMCFGILAGPTVGTTRGALLAIDSFRRLQLSAPTGFVPRMMAGKACYMWLSCS